MTGLGHLVNEHYGAVEADWHRFYGRSLKHDLWGTDPLPAREIGSMIRWLPPEAALWRSAGTSWTTANELQAATIEMIDSFLRVYITAHTKPGAQKPKPIRIPRPWDKAEKEAKRSTTLQDMLSNGLAIRRPAPKTQGGE
jgi:hypothetical protein